LFEQPKFKLNRKPLRSWRHLMRALRFNKFNHKEHKVFAKDGKGLISFI